MRWGIQIAPRVRPLLADAQLGGRLRFLKQLNRIPVMMKPTLVLCLLLAKATGQPIQPADPKCAKKWAGNQWNVTSDTSQTACVNAGGQWILQYKQTGYPDHHPLPKTWWMKRMADTGEADADHGDRLHFGGTPSERDMKLMYEAGVDAVLSLTTNSVGSMGIMPLPSTTQAIAVAKEAGMLYHTLAASSYFSSAGVDEIATFLDFALNNTGQKSSGNGPLYVSDSRGLKAAVAVQLFRARRKLITKGTASSVTAKAIVEVEHHGVSPTVDEIKAIAREAGETYDSSKMKVSMSTVAAKTAKDSIKAYHWLKYLYNIGGVGVFDAGQIQTFHVKALKEANIKVIINMRQGQEVNGAWSGKPQEPINLLNLGFGGPTKNISNVGESAYNASKYSLIIDDSRPPSWCEFDTHIIHCTPIQSASFHGNCPRHSNKRVHRQGLLLPRQHQRDRLPGLCRQLGVQVREQEPSRVG